MGGLKVQRIDSTIITQFRFQNLADLLALYTPLAFKNYGPGQLNTVSFRGTSPNHTALLWNGLNINSPLLGQSDFSTFPMAAFNQLAVQYGSAASAVGSDAVGGSILVGSSAPSQGFVSMGRQQESFNNHQTQAQGGFSTLVGSNARLSGNTNVYFGKQNNHFPYTQRRGYALLPSETLQKGFVQDLFFVPKSGQELSAHIWLSDSKLTLMPLEIQGREMTRTEAYRTMLRYRIGDLQVRTSWVRDIIDYAKGDLANPDHSLSDKFANRIEKAFEWRLGKVARLLAVNAGLEFTHFRAEVAGYEKPVVTENRSDFFVMTRFQATNRALLSVNFRQALVKGYNPLFTPSFGAEYLVLQKNNYALKWKGSVGRSYRVPTLNERFWAELGNPDIKPESGWNKEMTLDNQFALPDYSITATITGYHNRVKDWTYWNPSKNYRVENLQQVLARGLEVQAGISERTGIWKKGLLAGYALTKSAQEKAYDAYSADVIGKQLVFIPIHAANMNAFVQYKKMKVTAQVQKVGKRFVTFDNSQFLSGYTLLNLIAETTFDYQKIRMTVRGQANNVTNTFYLNVRNNAMPGTSVMASIVISYLSLANSI